MKKFLLLLTGMLTFSNFVFSQVEYNSSGSNGNYILSYPSSFGGAISKGIRITFKANHDNTGPANLKVNGFTAIPIKKAVGIDLVVNDILTGQIVTVVYDGMNFQMTSASGNISAGGDFMKDGSQAMTGNFDAGGNDLVNIAYIDINDNSVLGLGQSTTANQSTLTAPFNTTSDKGKTWYNTNLNKIAYWDGTGTQYLSPYPSRIQDGDNNTYIETDQSNDDKIHFNMNGSEYFQMDGKRLLVLNANQNVLLGTYSNPTASGGSNTIIGWGSGNAITTGDENVAIGSSCLHDNIGGIRNVAIGSEALNKSIGGNNIGIGYEAGFSNVGGNSNIAIGSEALRASTGASYNIAIGGQAGYLYNNGHRNLFIGHHADATVGGLKNATAIGHEAKVGQDNTIALGGTGGFATKVGIGTPTPSTLLEIKGGNDAAITLDCGSLKKSEIVFEETNSFMGSIGYANNTGEDYIYLYESGNALIAQNGRVTIGGTTTPTSDLNVEGSVSNSLFVETVSSTTFTLDETYHTVVVDGTSVGTTTNIHLPTASSSMGREYRISKTTGSGKVKVIPYSGEFIDNTYSSTNSYHMISATSMGVVIISNGVDGWYFVSKF